MEKESMHLCFYTFSYVIYSLNCRLRNLNLVSFSMVFSHDLHDSIKTCFIIVTLYSSVVFRYYSLF